MPKEIQVTLKIGATLQSPSKPSTNFVFYTNCVTLVGYLLWLSRVKYRL